MSIRQRARAGVLVALVVMGLQLLLPFVPLAHDDHPADASTFCATCLEISLCQDAAVAAPPPSVSACALRHPAPPLEPCVCAAEPAVLLAPARAPPSVLG